MAKLIFEWCIVFANDVFPFQSDQKLVNKSFQSGHTFNSNLLSCFLFQCLCLLLFVPEYIGYHNRSISNSVHHVVLQEYKMGCSHTETKLIEICVTPAQQWCFCCCFLGSC